MEPKDLELLVAYNQWANARTLDAASRLDAEAFRRDLGGSYPSIHDTLVHVLLAERLWLARWQGNSPRETLDPAAFENVDALRAPWHEVETGQRAFVRALAPDALARVLSYVNTRGETWSYPLASMIQHVVNHSTYHRGQVATMLRQLGAEPIPTDLLVFADEGHPGLPSVKL